MDFELSEHKIDFSTLPGRSDTIELDTMEDVAIPVTAITTSVSPQRTDVDVNISTESQTITRFYDPVPARYLEALIRQFPHGSILTKQLLTAPDQSFSALDLKTLETSIHFIHLVQLRVLLTTIIQYRRLLTNSEMVGLLSSSEAMKRFAQNLQSNEARFENVSVKIVAASTAPTTTKKALTMTLGDKSNSKFFNANAATKTFVFPAKPTPASPVTKLVTTAQPTQRVIIPQTVVVSDRSYFDLTTNTVKHAPAKEERMIFSESDDSSTDSDASTKKLTSIEELKTLDTFNGDILSFDYEDPPVSRDWSLLVPAATVYVVDLPPTLTKRLSESIEKPYEYLLYCASRCTQLNKTSHALQRLACMYVACSRTHVHCTARIIHALVKQCEAELRELDKLQDIRVYCTRLLLLFMYDSECFLLHMFEKDWAALVRKHLMDNSLVWESYRKDIRYLITKTRTMLELGWRINIAILTIHQQFLQVRNGRSCYVYCLPSVPTDRSIVNVPFIGMQINLELLANQTYIQDLAWATTYTSFAEILQSNPYLEYPEVNQLQQILTVANYFGTVSLRSLEMSDFPIVSEGIEGFWNRYSIYAPMLADIIAKTRKAFTINTKDDAVRLVIQYVFSTMLKENVEAATAMNKLMACNTMCWIERVTVNNNGFPEIRTQVVWGTTRIKLLRMGERWIGNELAVTYPNANSPSVLLGL